MISFNHFYLLLAFTLLTLIPFGNTKECTWAFARIAGDPTHSSCSDDVNTYSFPNENCKPKKNSKMPPAASKCVPAEPNIPKFSSGNCPTYWTMGDYRKKKQAGFSCDLLISQGGGPNGQDKYGKYNCAVLSNMISCTGKGKLISDKRPEQKW
ncbi:secreted protein [Melampsora americana]|nr:secreted protein [Melampsora americana]